MAIIMTAKWKTKPGTVETVREALWEFVVAVRDNEPGTWVYNALQEAGDPAAFMTYFVFADAAARDLHRQTEWVKKFTGTIYPVAVEPVEFTEYELVATTRE